MTMNKIKITALMLGALLTFTACSSTATTTTTTTDTKITTTPVEVTEVEVSDMTNTVLLSGKIASAREVYVAPVVQGKVLNVYVLEGDTVKAGQTLFTVDNSDTQRQYDDLKQQYEETIELNEKSLDLLRQNLEISIESLEEARQDIEDLKALYEIGGVAKNDIDAAELALKQQEPSITQQEVNLIQTESQMNTGLQTFETQLKNLEDVLVYGKVTAPISGVVTAMNVIEGTMSVSTTGDPLVAISEVDAPQVSIDISETLLPFIKAGTDVKITVPSVSSEGFMAEVRSVSTTTNPMTGLYTVTVDVPLDQDYVLGMFVNAEFTTDNQTAVVNVPASAILTDDSNQYVFIIENSKARKVYVTTGITNGTNTEITSGLIGAEQLVIVGQEYLSNDTAVEVVGG